MAHQIDLGGRQTYVIRFYELAEQRLAIKMSKTATNKLLWAVAERPETFCSLPSLAAHETFHKTSYFHERAEHHTDQ